MFFNPPSGLERPLSPLSFVISDSFFYLKLIPVAERSRGNGGFDSAQPPFCAGCRAHQNTVKYKHSLSSFLLSQHRYVLNKFFGVPVFYSNHRFTLEVEILKHPSLFT
jgi:hypothetical protein